MSTRRIAPIVLNFKDIRLERQKTNNRLVYSLIEADNKLEFEKNINGKELTRVLEELEFTFDKFWERCRESRDFGILAAGRLAKCASRQGTKDEEVQLTTCNITSSKFGINITNLSATALRPTKDGEIVSARTLRERDIPKDCCLKSFDGLIEGQMSGYITAKVAYGAGGHQDNVFEEVDTSAEWWTKFKAGSPETLVMLIDTDLTFKFNRIKEKYQIYDNIKVFNHVDFQNYIIELYSPTAAATTTAAATATEVPVSHQ